MRSADTGSTSPGFGTGELLRKLIHVLVSVAAVTLVWWLPASTARLVLASAAAVALATEILRRTSTPVQSRFTRVFGSMLRPRETTGLTGATTLALGFLIAGLLFAPRFAGAGILFAGVGDAASALVGRAWGRTRFPGGKSLEGSLAFLLAAFAAGWVAPGIPVLTAALAALVTTLVEALPSAIDDNLTLPLAGAAAAWAAGALLA